ncbi:MAG: hypothetical protein COU35_04295 [Candidatus Magasanikbacteria bacterium CG10_big_fil_rev_8_21_14_0_10_47_10]|uniref:DedA family protein n=1 Tax=Candidatus Magasanikbacteria bacterium CG10_big_fil_rev_8_21_14_0_10_47_10 TaxID=1974652 RepID=A0A2H0TPG6_9BACT|nr:MAG: hypothetical protein COU35_04295 [Candidatus Magasanikbacteria bacterium CG10_big_fil_rev_8_21_14_0_10_47_10]
MKKKTAKRIRNAVMVAGFIGLIFWINGLELQGDVISMSAQRYGYIGIFFGAVLSGFNIIIPVPIVSFFPFFVELGLSAPLTVVIIGVGMTVGDFFGYIIGMGTSSAVIENSKTIERMKNWQEKNPYYISIFLFIYAAVMPLPNEIVVIPAAFVQTSMRRVILPVLAGNIFFNASVAFGLFHFF